MSYSDNTTTFTTPMDQMLSICLSLGLAPPRGTDYPRESDHGLIDQVVLNESRSVQAQGWWFNITFGEELEPDIYGEITLPDALKVSPCKWQLNYHDPHVRLDGQTGLVVNLEDGTTIWEKPLNADVIRHVDPKWCPMQFQDYIAWRVINKLAPVFGSPQDKSSEAQAWAELVRADNELRPSINTFDHPILARTVSN